MLGITAYAVLGSADFGAGFWDLTAGGDRRGGRVRGMIQRSMSPVWEANHVWLIFVLVIVWTAFPVAFGSIFSTLSIPLFLAAIGIIFRGAAFALARAGGRRSARRACSARVFASSSVLIPFCFGAALGGVASGRVEVGNAAGRPVELVAEPDLGADRRARRRSPARTWPPSSWPATRSAPGSRTSWRRSARARWPAASSPARSRSAALLVVRSRRARPVRRADLGRRPRVRARLRRRRAGHARARRARALSARRASPPRRPSAR